MATLYSNELRAVVVLDNFLDNPKNIYSDRYITFSKHRRGDVGVKLYYNLSTQGDVSFDEERYEQDINMRHLQSDVSAQLRDFAEQFDRLFNNT